MCNRMGKQIENVGIIKECDKMKNLLVMRAEATYALNFLIYIQNLYLNQYSSEEGHKFPCFPLNIAFREDFELKFKDLWDDVSHRIFDNHSNDMKIVYEEKDLFYQSLFVNNSNSLKEYNEIYKTFKVWWDSFAGRFSIERSIDEKIQKLYEELANTLVRERIEPQKELSISLIYDECVLVNLDVSSYFIILSIKDFFIKYKKLVPKLQECIY
jgi:hypothetical protein